MNIEYRVNAEIDSHQLQGLFNRTSWAADRPIADIRTMLENTAVHVSAWRGEKLVGFARAITDMIYSALIDDVVVDAAHRGRGIGTQLMKTMGEELSGVEEVDLGCDIRQVPFYERLGYVRAHHPLMKRLRKRT